MNVENSKHETEISRRGLLPDELKIGHLKIDVVLDTPDSTADGLADFDNSKISIRPCMPLNREQQVLLHECLHFIFDNAGVKHTPKIHQLIDVVASGLVALLKDNKQIARYLVSERRRK